MIFASVKRGQYMIVESDRVVANIRAWRQPIPCPIPGKIWSRRRYVVTWDNGEFEEFKTLPDIHDKYHFTNYSAYGCVLKRRTNASKIQSLYN